MDRADVMLALQVIATVVAVLTWWRGRQGKPRPGRHRKRKRR